MWLLSYWVLPVISATLWLATLLTMFFRWIAISQPQYPSMEASQAIAYISDVGAFSLKPVFISGAVLTTLSLDLSLLAERYLRHTHRLAPNTSSAQKILSAVGSAWALVGSAGLILLSIFDTYRHPRLHNVCLLLFMGGYLLSAIFLCAEYQRLGIHYRRHRILRASFWIKLTFILVEVLLAAAFVATTFTHRRNAGAVLEWVVALVFTGYIASFLLDLLPSVRTRHRVAQGGEGMRDAGVGVSRAGEGEYEHGLTNHSAGPVANGSNADDGVDGGKSTERQSSRKKQSWMMRRVRNL